MVDGISWLYFRLLQGHIVLFGVAALMLKNLVKQIGLLARFHGGRVFHGAEIVVFRHQPAAEDYVAVEGAANLQIDRLGGVIPHPLGIDGVIVPACKRAIYFDLYARLVHAAKNTRAVDLHPKVVAPDLELQQFKDHVRVGTEIQFDLVADGDVFDRLGN